MSSTEQETMQGIEKLVSDDVYEAAQTSSNGLEASQVQKRQELYGLYQYDGTLALGRRCSCLL